MVSNLCPTNWHDVKRGWWGHWRVPRRRRGSSSGSRVYSHSAGSCHVWQPVVYGTPQEQSPLTPRGRGPLLSFWLTDSKWASYGHLSMNSFPWHPRGQILHDSCGMNLRKLLHPLGHNQTLSTEVGSQSWELDPIPDFFFLLWVLYFSCRGRICNSYVL